MDELTNKQKDLLLNLKVGETLPYSEAPFYVNEEDDEYLRLSRLETWEVEEYKGSNHLVGLVYYYYQKIGDNWKRMIEPQKILSIKEVSGIEHEYWDGDGYLVETEKLNIYLLISNSTSCCENWGYATSEDNLERFIGATLMDFYITDSALNTKYEYDFYEGDVMFLTFQTNIGPFQLVVYNIHNGYYGHVAILKINDEVKVNVTL